MKSLLQRLNPSVVTGVLAAILSIAAAFGAPITAAQSASILVFGGAIATILFAHGLTDALKYLEPETVTGLVTAAIALAVSFGAPITHEQAEHALIVIGGLAAVLVGHGVVRTVRGSNLAEIEQARTAAAGLSPEISVTTQLSDEAHVNQGRGRWQPTVTMWRGSSRRRALGRRAPKNAPAIRAERILTGNVPQIPLVTDHFQGATFGLYGNDKYGDCGPTSVANLVRLLSKLLTGTQVTPSQQDVFTLYRQSGNPTFNPATDAGDEGVDMQTMLEALLKHGIGGVFPVAFARLTAITDANLEAINAVFGGCLWGVTLERAQETQTDASPARWDYQKSAEWGGHAVLNGKNEPLGAATAVNGPELEDVISWATAVQTTDAFRSRQLDEVWVVIFPWHLEHPGVLEGLDVEALRAEYKLLTGKELVVPVPVPVPPAPAPSPTPAPVTEPASSLDRALWAIAADWAQNHRHSGTVKKVANGLVVWARGKGLA